MSAHENISEEDVIEPGSDRSFGYIVGGIVAAVGVYQYFTGSQIYLWFLAPGAVLVLLGLVLPKALHPLNIAWTKLGVLLGKIVTPIVMFLVYALSVVPIGLALRLFGKDLLSLKRSDSAKSYWVQRAPPGPPAESLKDQF